MRFALIRKKWFIIAMLIVLGVVGYVWYRKNSTTKEATYVQVKREVIEQTIEVPGKVKAFEKANLRFLGGGKIVSLPAKEGQVVKKGTKIASIDARDLEKSLQSSLLDYSSTRTDFDQGFDDRKDSALTDTLRRAANKLQYSLDKSVVAVELRDIALKNASLVSPIDGVVTAIPVDSVGVQVTVSDIFEIINPASLYFEAEVDEADVGHIQVGLPVRIVLDAYPDDPVESQVGYIGLTARSSSKSSGGTVFPVRVSVPISALAKYRLGMNGTMSIVIARRENALSVPLEAITQTEGKVQVKLQSDDLPQGKDVQIQTGIEGETSIEVLSGLTESDKVLIPE